MSVIFFDIFMQYILWNIKFMGGLFCFWIHWFSFNLANLLYTKQKMTPCDVLEFFSYKNKFLKIKLSISWRCDPATFWVRLKKRGINFWLVVFLFFNRRKNFKLYLLTICINMYICMYVVRWPTDWRANGQTDSQSL